MPDIVLACASHDMTPHDNQIGLTAKNRHTVQAIPLYSPSKDNRIK